MDVGNTVWVASYGNVRRAKIVAFDDAGEEVCLQCKEWGMFTAKIASLFWNKAGATAYCLNHRKKVLESDIKTLNEKFASVTKQLDEVISSLKAEAEG